MTYYDILASLFPQGPYNPNAPTLKTFLEAFGSLLDADNANGVKLVNNLSPFTADADGITAWEKTLNLPTDTNLDLETRRRLSIARSYRLPGVLTYSKLVQILNSFSPTDSAKVIESPSLYQVEGVFPIDDIADYQPILKTVYSYLPAHLQFLIGFKTTIPETPTIRTTQQVIITRNILENNDGPMMDGTWPLDGSKPLNSQANPAPKVSSTVGVAVSRNIEWGHIPVTRGFVLDGGRKLDGSWNLAGATTQNDDPAAFALNFIVGRAITETPQSSHADQITVTRRNTVNGGFLLDGSWNLDGSRNLSGQKSLAVTVNGAPV